MPEESKNNRTNAKKEALQSFLFLRAFKVSDQRRAERLAIANLCETMGDERYLFLRLYSVGVIPVRLRKRR